MPNPNNEDIKWLYGKLKSKGYNIGSEQEFTSSLANDADRQWYYEKAKGMGLNIGSMDDFNSLYAPAKPQPTHHTQTQPVKPQPKVAAPVHSATPQPAQPQQAAPVRQPVTYFRLRRGGKDFNVSADEVQKAGGLQAWANRHPGAPVRVYMQGNGFNGHVDLSQAHNRYAKQGYKYSTTTAKTPVKAMSRPEKQPTVKPAEQPMTDMQKEMLLDNLQGIVNNARSSNTRTIQQMKNKLEYDKKSRNGFLGGPVEGGVQYNPSTGKMEQTHLTPQGYKTTSKGDADMMSQQYREQQAFRQRMKVNGLKPDNKEDVQKQMQLDEEKPMRDVLNDVWGEAEAQDKKAQEAWRNRADKNARGFSLSDAAAASSSADAVFAGRGEDFNNDLEYQKKRHAIFDFDKMANTMYARLPEDYRRGTLERYTDYFKKHPKDAKGKTAAIAAKDALMGDLYRQVYERAKAQDMPKSKLEFLLRKIADQPLISSSMAANTVAAWQTGSHGLDLAEQDAMSVYGSRHKALNIAGTVANMALDPVTYAAGGVGGVVGKKALQAVGKQALKGATKKVAERYAAGTLAGRVAQGVAGGAANFGTFNTVKGIQQQMAVGGTLDENGKPTNELSAGDILKETAHGLMLGAATGTLSPLIGNVADKAVKATSSTAGKVALRAGQTALSTLAEGTVFAIPDMVDKGKWDWDTWTDSQAMMLGFKASHAIKSAPRVLQGLQREDRRIGLNFEERLRKQLDASPADIGFKPEEMEELRDKGYTDLSMLFRDANKRKADKSTGIEERTDDYENLTPDRFDGYEAMKRLMNDNSVSEATRAKAYYILTGHMLPMSTVTGYTQDNAVDGSVVINSVNARGGVVTTRRFANEQAAQQEKDNIMRQAELNSVTVGEKYKETASNMMVVEQAIKDVAPDADVATVLNNYKMVKNGQLTDEAYVKQAQAIDEAIERNRHIADPNRPEAIRENIKKETGIDVDTSLRKMPAKRTEKEQAVVDEYVRSLFPEQKRQENESGEQQPTADEAADADFNNRLEQRQQSYDEGRAAFDTADTEGDRSDSDAIMQRVKEAYEEIDRVFGDEAEMRLAQLEDDPWEVAQDDSLTEEQQDAVAYFINAKAAMDGLTDAANDNAENKRADIDRKVEQHTNKQTGMIHPATLKVDNRPVYIVSGNVAMFPDGSGVDKANSSESVVVCDAETGEVKFISPDMIYSVEKPISADQERQAAYDAIESEQQVILGNDGPEQRPTEPGADNEINETNGVNGVNVEQTQKPAEKVQEPMPMRKDGEEDWQATTPERAHTGETPARAIDKIPSEQVIDKKGNTRTVHHWEQAPAEDTYDAMTQDVFDGDAKAADDYANGVAERLDKEIKKLDKEIAKGTTGESLDDILEAKKRTQKLRDQREALQQRKKYWQNVRNVPVERNRAKAEDEARAAARAQAEAEANDLASVPEWGEDTPQAARDREFRRESDHKIERQKPLKATTGNEVDVRFSQKDVVKGKVAVVDASQLQASHVNRRRNPRYFLDEAQPKERTDEASLMASHRIAQDVRPAEITGSATAYSGAPVVNSRGEVIQGNNRTDALKRMYDEDQYKESAEKYKQYLMDHAEEFGLNPEDIAKMKHPVLVNMVDVSDEEAIRLGQMSAADTESGGVERIRPQQTRQKMDDRQMGVFLRILLNDGNDQTLSISELIANNGIEAVKYLHQIGAISDTQMESAVSNGALTDEAKTDIKNLLFETVFHGAPTTLREIFNSMPKAAQRAILATAWRDASSDAKNSMIGEIQKSIYAWNDMRTSFGEELKASKSKENTRLLVGNWMQQLIFNTATGQPERVTEKYSNFAIELATRYFTDKQTELQDMFNDLFDQIQGTSDNLFDPEGSVPKSLGEAIKKVLGIDYKPLNKKSDVNRKRQTGSNGVDRNDKKSEGGQSGSAGDTEGGEQGPQGARAADSGRGAEGNDGEGSLEEVTPIGTGDFGPIYDQFKGKPNEAIKFLSEKKDGEAVGALHHKDIGDIDLVWGKEGSGHSDGYGLAKLVKYHPEVLNDLQGIIDDMRVTKRTDNRVNLESDTHMASVRLTWNDKEKKWLLTAFEKESSAIDNTTDTAETLSGKRNDTATPQSTASASKDSEKSTSEQEKSEKVAESQPSKEQLPSTGPSQQPSRNAVRIVQVGDFYEVYGDDADVASKVLGITAIKRTPKSLAVAGFPKHALDAYLPKLIRAGYSVDIEEGGKVVEHVIPGTTAEKTAARQPETAQEEGKAEQPNEAEAATKGSGITPQSTPSAGKDSKSSDTQQGKSEEKGQEAIGTTSNEATKQAERDKVNTEPSEKQKEAGNYKKGHIKVDGYDVTIENPKGSTRSGKDANGKEWSIKMNYDYGYIKGTEGVDGDHIDVYLSDNPASGNVYVVDQIDQQTGKFDEHKVMYGFPSKEAAIEAYKSQYTDGWKVGKVTEVSREDFKKWVESSKRKTKPFAEYSSVKKSETKKEPTDEELARLGKAVAEGEEGKKHDKVHGEVEPVTEEEAELRDAVAAVLRKAGIGVIGDDAEGKRVLDMAKGHARMMSVDEAKAAVEKINAIKPTVVKDLGRRSRAEVKADYDRLQPVEKDGASIEFYHGVFGKAWHGEDSLFAKVVPWLHDILQNSVLAYSETDILAGEVRPDGTVHKEHFNIVAYHNYVGKVKIGDKDYYVRFTVQEDKVGNQGTHSFFVSDVSLYNNTAGDVTTDTKNHLGNTSANGIVDAKLKQFFDYAKGKGEKISFLKAYHGSAADFDEFDTMNHLSEGEGSQVYGAGTYVTDHKGLGKKYAKIAQNYTRTYKGEPIDEDPTKLDPYRTAADIVKVYGNMKEARAWGKRLLNYAADEKTREFREKILDILEHSAAKDFSHQSFLYTVEIPDDNGKNYLDWDGRVDRYLDQFGISVKEYEENDMVSIGDAYLYLSRKLGSDKAASEMLSKAGYTGIKVHAARTSGDKRYQQNWNYVIFNDDDVKIGDKVKFFRTADGEAYGFTVGGKIYIDPKIAKADTPIHEYTHLWAEALRKVNPKEWQNVVGLMKQCKEIWEQVKKEYPELTTDDEIADEVLAHYSGKRGAERLRAEMRKAMDGEKSMIKKAGIARAFDALRDSIKRFWKHISEDIFHIHFTSAEEVADKVMYDLLNKVKPGAHDQLAEERAEIERRAKEDGTWMKAPNGKKSNLSEEQWVTVRTKQFKDWFGDWENDPEEASQAVDENGEPKVFYHNTDNDFTVFDANKNGTHTDAGWLGDGFYFYGDENEGNGYGHKKMGVFLNARNFYYASSEENEKLAEANNRDKSIAFRNEIEDEGYDAVYYNGDLRQEAVVFYPEQIKSATDNVGTFDETNPDIRYQFVGEKGAASADRAEEATTRLDNLSVARKMEEAGKDAHNIKMATGWERGADEKWRYEIPDFRNIDPRGNIDFFKNNPDYKRYFDLIAKSNKAYFFNGEFTKEEERELSALDRKLHGLEYQTFRNPDKLTLKDYMDAPELFKAYPQLRNLPVKIEALPDNTEGAYTYQDGAPVIKISKGIMDSALAGVTIPFKRVMAHEIQHAIQLEEGFAKGGSEEMSDYLRKNRALERRDDTELYASLAGEVEARNAARRVAMTDEQRRRNLASDTEDVSREDQIYLYDSFGIARSEEANDNGKRDGEEDAENATGGKTLMGVHNISIEKLLKAIRQGGLANPSMAVVNTENGIHDKFGEISLIPPSSLIDKIAGKNAGTWTGDAYTPRYPKTELRMSARGRKKYDSDMSALAKKDPTFRELWSDIDYGYSQMLEGRDDYDSIYSWFLADTDRKIPTVEENYPYPEEYLKRLNAIAGKGEVFSRKILYELTPEQKEEAYAVYRDYAKAHNIEGLSILDFNVQKYKALAKRAEKSGLGEERVKELLDKAEESKKYGDALSNMTDRLELMGRYASRLGSPRPLDKRATFAAGKKFVEDNGLKKEFATWLDGLQDRYDESEYFYTGTDEMGRQMFKKNSLRNASAYMKVQGRAGSEGSFTGFGGFAAKHMKQLSTTEQIRTNKGLIREGAEERNRLENLYFDLIQMIMERTDTYNPEAFVDEIAEASDPISFAKKEYGIKLPKEYAEKQKALIDGIQKMPALYFETKFERPVYLSEFEKAVVPDETPQSVVEALTASGIEVYPYKSGDEESRKAVTMQAVNDSDDILFRLGDKAETFEERQQRAVKEKGVVMPGLNKAEVKVVDVPRHSYTGTIAEATKQAIDAAKEKYAPNGKPIEQHYDNHGQKFDYTISGSAIDESLNPKQQAKSDNKGVHLAVVEHLDEVIGESIEVEEHPDYKKNSQGERDVNSDINDNALMHRFYGAVVVDGQLYRVMILMREDGNPKIGKGLHAYEVTKVEVLNGKSPSTSSGVGSGENNSSYPLAKLLQNVEKSYDPGKKILDESAKADENSDAGEEDNLYRTSGEIDAEYPNWLEGTTTDSGKHTTQVAGTRKTYGHVGDWIERHIGKDARILDASSGMGYGTKDLRQRGFNIEDVEPYQSEERKRENPATYSSYGDVEGKYDYIISNAVLNVIPDDWRSDVLHDMASRLKAGGRLFINTRKAGEEKGIKDKIELDSPQEVLVKRNGKIASYQRFFTPQELKEYVEKELGEGYKVEIANEENSGTKGLAAVVVTKESQGESTGAKAASSSVQRMTSAVNDLAQKLHLNNVEIVTEPITVRDKNGKVHRPKGYFNPKTGKITISIANNADVDDAVSTLLHEAVAHYGLREMLGEDFDTFLDNVFANVNDDIRKKIEDAAKKRYDGDTRTATEEYLASLAEDENFEEARKQGVWDKIKDLFFELLHKVGVKLKRKLTDNDLRYMLWRSYENLKDGGKGKTMLQEAADAAKRDELGIRNEAAETASQAEENREVGEKSRLWGKHDMVSLAKRTAAGEDPELLFRDSVGPQDETARKIYDKRADAALMKIREAWQDSMINVKNLQDAVLEQRGEKIEDWENAYMQENNLHGVSRAESECFTDNFYKPLLEEVNKAAKGWYDRRTGRITIVAGNHTSVADAESTLLHEAVAHYGLRQLLGDTVNLLLAAAAYNFKRAKRSRFCTFLSNST